MRHTLVLAEFSLWRVLTFGGENGYGIQVTSHGVAYIWISGPYMSQMCLIIMDAHSKWQESHIMSSITSTMTIQVLR